MKQSRPNRNPDEDWLLAPGSGAWFAGKDIERTVPKVPYVSFKTLGQAAGDVLMEQPGRQVAHMRDFVAGDDGIYVSSGIPNKVFYDVSNAISVEHSSEIWFAALRKLPKDAKFLDAAEITIALAGQRFGMNSREQQSLRTAWKSVGVLQDDATESGTRNP